MENKKLQKVLLIMKKEIPDQWKDMIYSSGIKSVILNELPKDMNDPDALLITDDPSTAVRGCELGMVCIGYTQEDAFFPGAVVTTDDVGVLDAVFLEDTWLHAKGFPVCVMTTDRIQMREMTEEDFPFVQHLMEECDQSLIFDSEEEAEGFSRERLSSYIKYMYSFYGYGLWMVLDSQGNRIGCCGFGNWETGQGDGSVRVELQYVLDSEYRGMGYALEMCQAALKYAAERMEEEIIWLRIREDNLPSRKLADKLGFTVQNKTGECLHLILSMVK